MRHFLIFPVDQKREEYLRLDVSFSRSREYGAEQDATYPKEESSTPSPYHLHALSYPRRDQVSSIGCRANLMFLHGVIEISHGQT
jgi:hypothetical protein